MLRRQAGMGSCYAAFFTSRSTFPSRMWMMRCAWSAMSASCVTSTMVLPGLVETLEERHDLDARLGVEVARGLVGQEDRRVVHERARDGHALTLPAGELVRLVAHPVVELDAPQRFLGAILPFFRGDARVDERQFHVVERGRAREEVEGLEDEPNLLVADARQLVVVHLADLLLVQQVAALRRRVEAPDQVHQRRLPRPGRAHDGHVFAFVDGDVDAAERVDLLGSHDVGFPEVLGFDDGHFADT